MASAKDLHQRGTGFDANGKRVFNAALLWKWAIHRVIIQKAVARTTAFLARRGEMKEDSVGATAEPVAVSTEGREWDAWLDAETKVLRQRLEQDEIDLATHDRRVALLEARWSANI